MVAVPQQYHGLVADAARQLRIPADVVAAQLNVESGFDPTALSPTGAKGIAQFEPGTWTDLRCGGSPDNPNDAIKCYVRYMHQLLGMYHGNVQLALAAYNAGPGNVQAGLGYANTILGNAGQSPGLQVAAGSSGSGSSSSPQAVTASATIQSYDPSACFLGFPGIRVPIIGNIGQFCIFSKSQARGMIGAGLLVIGTVGLADWLLLAALKAGVSKAAPILAAVPGGGAAAQAARITGAAAGGGAVSGVRQTQREAEGRQRRARQAEREASAAARRRERAEREAARTAPARGRHAKPGERGPYEGRHRGS